MILAPKVIVLIYGTAFNPAISAFQWLAVVWIIAALSGHYRYGLIASGYQAIEMVISAIGALSAFILIPLGYRVAGISGAAVGLIFAEMIVWIGAWWFAKLRLSLVGNSKYLIGPLATIFVTTLILWIRPDWPILFKIIVGTATICAQAFIYDGAIRNDLSQIISNWKPWIRGQLGEGLNNLLNR